jgi:hypothetical protein
MGALYPIHPLPCGVLHRVTYRGAAMSRRLAVPVVTAALLAPAAAAQAAPVLDPLKPCYVAVGVDPATGYYRTQKLPITGSGFTPNSAVDVTVDGVTALTGVPVDAGGLLAAEARAPFQEHGQRPFSVTLTEQGNPAQTVTAESLVTRLEVLQKPRVSQPRQLVRFTGSGFTMLGRGVYAHYLRAGRHKKTVRILRRPASPCGTFRVHRRQFPFRPKVGTWIVQVDQRRSYSAEPSTAFVRLRIRVKREPAKR